MYLLITGLQSKAGISFPVVKLLCEGMGGWFPELEAVCGAHLSVLSATGSFLGYPMVFLLEKKLIGFNKVE